MLDARTQAGDHGHPRAFAHAVRSELPTVETMHKNSGSLGNPTSHRKGFPSISKAAWRLVYSEQTMQNALRAHTSG